MIAPQGKRPLFAQVYTMDPENAKKNKSENIEAQIEKKIRPEIIEKIEELMKQNPYAKTFMKAGEMLREVEKSGKEVPHFQVYHNIL